jgi:predicted TIM-barrel fold metal-dependent hydrolase
MIDHLSMIVDIHVHIPFLDLEKVQPGWRETFKEMLEAGERAGIDKQVVLGLSKNNELVKELLDAFPDKLIGFIRGICQDPDAPAILEKFVKVYGFKGVKIHSEPNLPLRGLLAGHPIFLKAAELRVPVLIHSWHEEEGLTQEAREVIGAEHVFPMRIAAELGKNYPNTTFIFAHAGGIWVKAFQAAKHYPNLYFDTSGFDPERGIVEKAVEVLGPERILFGSDAPGRNYAAQLAKVQYADISENDKRLILGENAAKLLELV